jgi:hypothetical protein
MAHPIDALKYKVYGFKDGDYYPFACSQSMELAEETDIIPTTTVGTGKRRTFTTGFTSATLSLGGVMFLRDLAETKWHILEFFENALITSGLNILIEWKDQQDVIQNRTGSALIRSKTISGTVGQLTKWNIDFQFSGDMTTAEMILPVLLDEDGNPMLDEDGNPITIE